MESVTQLLAAYRDGDKGAFDRLVPLVYDELRRIAARYLGRERGGHTLQPTALVNEAYLRLVQYENLEYKNRAHFVGIAARLMRQVLVDHARTHGASKRGGEQQRVTLDEGVAVQGQRDLDLLALDDALRKLSEKDAHLVRLVELRYFGGLSIEETAEALGSSPATVKREWATAKVWLRRLMTGEGGGHDEGA
jgi:RNA polymerase sigma-70 factor (ECF subfamily)